MKQTLLILAFLGCEAEKTPVAGAAPIVADAEPAEPVEDLGPIADTASGDMAIRDARPQGDVGVESDAAQPADMLSTPTSFAVPGVDAVGPVRCEYLVDDEVERVRHYDGRLRLLEEERGAEGGAVYTWTGGQLSEVEGLSWGHAFRKVFTYDELGRLVEERSSQWGAEEVTRQEFVEGRLWRRTVLNSLLAAPLTVDTYFYEEGRLARVERDGSLDGTFHIEAGVVTGGADGAIDAVTRYSYQDAGWRLETYDLAADGVPERVEWQRRDVAGRVVEWMTDEGADGWEAYGESRYQDGLLVRTTSGEDSVPVTHSLAGVATPEARWRCSPGRPATLTLSTLTAPPERPLARSARESVSDPTRCNPEAVVPGEVPQLVDAQGPYGGCEGGGGALLTFCARESGEHRFHAPGTRLHLRRSCDPALPAARCADEVLRVGLRVDECVGLVVAGPGQAQLSVREPGPRGAECLQREGVVTGCAGALACDPDTRRCLEVSRTAIVGGRVVKHATRARVELQLQPDTAPAAVEASWRGPALRREAGLLADGRESGPDLDRLFFRAFDVPANATHLEVATGDGPLRLPLSEAEPLPPGAACDPRELANSCPDGEVCPATRGRCTPLSVAAMGEGSALVATLTASEWIYDETLKVATFDGRGAVQGVQSVRALSGLSGPAFVTVVPVGARALTLWPRRGGGGASARVLAFGGQRDGAHCEVGAECRRGGLCDSGVCRRAQRPRLEVESWRGARSVGIRAHLNDPEMETLALQVVLGDADGQVLHRRDFPLHLDQPSASIEHSEPISNLAELEGLLSVEVLAIGPTGWVSASAPAPPQAPERVELGEACDPWQAMNQCGVGVCRLEEAPTCAERPTQCPAGWAAPALDLGAVAWPAPEANHAGWVACRAARSPETPERVHRFIAPEAGTWRFVAQGEIAAPPTIHLHRRCDPLVFDDFLACNDEVDFHSGASAATTWAEEGALIYVFVQTEAAYELDFERLD